MNVTLTLPEDFAARFGPEPARNRRVLEALVLAEFRAGRLSEAELHQILGVDAGTAVDLWRSPSGPRDRTTDEAHELAIIRDRLLNGEATERQEASAALVGRFRAFAAEHTLGGLSGGDLISEGRR